MAVLAPLLLAALAQAAPVDCGARLERFREALGALRTGDRVGAQPLMDAARELCEDCQRCDALDVARYYLALSEADRGRGLEREARFAQLYDDVRRAGRETLEPAAWSRERERIGVELDDLARTAAGEADFVPSARARSLRARLQLARLEGDAALDPAAAEALARAIDEDCQRALEDFARAGQITPTLEPLWVRSRLALARRQWSAARSGMLAVEQLAERVGNADFLEHALRGRVELARASGDRRAEERLLVRLASLRDPRSNWPLARDWSEHLLADDHALEALDFLERTRPAPDAYRGDRVEFALLRGAAWMRAGELDAARAELEPLAREAPSETCELALAELSLHEGQSFEVRARLADDARCAGFSPRARVERWRLLGEERLASGDLSAAEGYLVRALDESERWRGGVRAQLDDVAGPRDPRALESVFGEWTGLHTVALLADARVRDHRPLDALRTILTSQARALRDGGARQSALPAAPVDVPAWVERCELGLLAYVLGADFGVAVLAWREPQGLVAVGARLSLSRRSAADLARRLREAAIADEPAWLEEERARARDALWPPAILDALRQRASSRAAGARLLIVASAALERMPFEILSLEPDGGPLDDALVLTLQPGLPSATPAARDAGSAPEWCLLGAPPAGLGFEALPGAQRELDELARLHPRATRASGARFDRQALLDALRGPRALHIATHLCAPAPDGAVEPALVTSDGLLDAREIERASAPHPLVVLPACESGGGPLLDGEGLLGVARAFLASGTPSVVVTTWPVSDRAAASFSAALHRELASGATPARAVHAARRALRALDFGPGEWAAFRSLGSE